MAISFFDDEQTSSLYPLTLTRPAADLRCGIFTLAEKWSHYLNASATGFETRDYLRAKFPAIDAAERRINGRLLPDETLVEQVKNLQPGQSLVQNGIVLAHCHDNGNTNVEFTGTARLLQRPFDIFLNIGTEIEADLNIIKSLRSTALLSETNRVIGYHSIFVEEGARIECSIINAEKGPVYIGKNAEIMEGCLVRGPFAMGEGCVLKLGAKVYGPTALGPYCAVGGEVNNISMQGFSNKGHDGFLGNAVLGEWCNIGADTNCSNLKNTYDEVKVWNYTSSRFERSGQQFCGLIMGDHSKCGINTMFNTGTVVGVAANIFGAGFPRQFIPDFAWGGAHGFETYKLEAAYKTAALVMPRRKKVFDENEQEILKAAFEMTKEWRSWE